METNKVNRGIGRKLTDEHKKKLSEARKNSKFKQGFQKGHTINLGKKYSEERRRNISLGQKGKIISQEQKDYLSKLNTGKSLNLTEEQRKDRSDKLKQAYRDGKRKNYKGGITEINFQIRHSFEMKLWRESVFKRDNWTCVFCYKKGGWSKEEKRKIELNADHIKPFATFPELRFDIDNGRTLCVDCHRKTDTWGGRTR